MSPFYDFLAPSSNLSGGLCVLLALILFLSLSKLAGRAIYFAALISYFLNFFFTMSKAISVSAGPIFTIFPPNGRYLREFS